MSSPPIRRGEIWRVDFGSNPVDPEQAFLRPALVVSDDALHHPRLRTVVVVPGTTTIRNLAVHVAVNADAENGLDGATAFQCEQLRAVSVDRLLERLGQLDVVSNAQIDEVLRNVIRLH